MESTNSTKVRTSDVLELLVRKERVILMTQTLLLKQPVPMMTQTVFPIAVGSIVMNHDSSFFWVFLKPGSSKSHQGHISLILCFTDCSSQ